MVDVEQEVGYIILDFEREVWIEDIQLGVVGIQMVFKVMGLGIVINGGRYEIEEDQGLIFLIYEVRGKMSQ